MANMRNRYNKGKKVRGFNRHTGVLGRWRRTQVDKVLSATAYRMLQKQGVISKPIKEEEE